MKVPTEASMRVEITTDGEVVATATVAGCPHRIRLPLLPEVAWLGPRLSGRIAGTAGGIEFDLSHDRDLGICAFASLSEDRGYMLALGTPGTKRSDERLIRFLERVVTESYSPAYAVAK